MVVRSSQNIQFHREVKACSGRCDPVAAAHVAATHVAADPDGLQLLIRGKQKGIESMCMRHTVWID